MSASVLCFYDRRNAASVLPGQVILGLLFIILLLIGGTAKVWAGDVPDPCKLLSESDMSKVLGINGPSAIETTPVAPLISRPHVVDRGAGNIGLSVPVLSGRRTNTLDCGGRVGSVKLSIEVAAIPQAQADHAENSKELGLLERKLGYKAAQTTYGNTVCKELLVPPTRGAESSNVAKLTCYSSKNGWQVSVAAQPWLPQKDPPVALEKLRNLADLAAQRVPPVPPTAAQNAVTNDTGTPAGFMSL
jgi:hypothetical protein